MLLSFYSPIIRRIFLFSDGQRPDALYLALYVGGLVGPVEKSVEKIELAIS